MIEMNTNMEQINYQDPKVREQLAKQYQSLVFKIARQKEHASPLEFDDIVGFGQEGLVNAINNFKEGMGQTFKQYAGYQILYSIQNGINSEGYTVKFSSYMRDKAKKSGKSTWIIDNIDTYLTPGDDDEITKKPPRELMITHQVNSEGVFENVFKAIETNFSKKDCDIFYRCYGLKDYDKVKGMDLAKEYHCTGANITVICKKIVNYIRKNQTLMDELSDLI